LLTGLLIFIGLTVISALSDPGLSTALVTEPSSTVTSHQGSEIDRRHLFGRARAKSRTNN